MGSPLREGESNIINPTAFENAQYLLDQASPAAKIVGEELDAFFENARRRLAEELPQYQNMDPAQISDDIRKAVAFRFGYPVAKQLTKVRRRQNSWNAFVNENYKKKFSQTDMDGRDGIFSLLFYNLRLLVEAKRRHVMKSLSEDWRAGVKETFTPSQEFQGVRNSNAPPIISDRCTAWYSNYNRIRKSLRGIVGSELTFLMCRYMN